MWFPAAKKNWRCLNVQINDNQKYLACLLAGAILIGAVWYVFSSYRAAGDNVDARLRDVETKLSDVATEQRKTSDAISAAQGTAGSIANTAESISAGLGEAQATADRGAGENAAAAESVRNAAATADECAASVEDSRKRLAECANIFDRIEQSNKGGEKSSGAPGKNP